MVEPTGKGKGKREQILWLVGSDILQQHRSRPQATELLQLSVADLVLSRGEL